MIKIDMPIKRDMSGVHVKIIGLCGRILGCNFGIRPFEGDSAIHGEQMLVVAI
jgi:hypothetical protein